MLEIAESNPLKPLRVMIYGVEGIGKSTLGAKSDKPIFITPEGGIDQLTDIDGRPSKSIKGMESWDSVRKAVKALFNEKHPFETLVIDSADWLEKLCHASIIGKSGKSIITCNGGYGAGYRQSEIMHRDLLEDLSKLRDNRNMNIVVTAHAAVRVTKDPSTLSDYDSFEIKCHEMVSSLWREYVDALLFARFRTFVQESEGSTRARAYSDGKRIVYTHKQPSFQAKNRYGLPEEMEFTETYWSELKSYRDKQTGGGNKDSEALQVLLKEQASAIEDAELKAKVEHAIENAGLNKHKLEVIAKRLQEVGSKS